MPRTSSTPSPPPGRSMLPKGRNSRRPPRRSPMTWTSCSRSMTTRPSTGSTCAPRTRSSQPSPRSGTAPRSPRVPAPRRRPRHGLQADRVSTGPLARRQRAPPRGTGPRRRHLHQRKAHRAARSESRAGSRLNDHDPQVLTIARPAERTEIHEWEQTTGERWRGRR